MNHDEASPDGESVILPAESTEESSLATEESTSTTPPPEINLSEATLPQLVEAAQAGRMGAALETKTTESLCAALLGGKPEIAEALDAIAKLPWPVSVNAINGAWLEMKPYGKRLFVSGMKGPAFAGEIGRRIRLSITRGLVKVDEPQAAKWACAIAAEMLGEDGILATRDRQSFFNVLVGKGKPWLLRLQLEGLKDSDVAALLNAAVGTIFLGGCPPFTQSTLLQWIFKLEKTASLSEKAQTAIAASIRKWPGRLLRDFKVLPEALPPLIAEAFAEKNSRRTNQDVPTENDKGSEKITRETVEVDDVENGEEDDEEDENDEDDEEDSDSDDDENEDLPPKSEQNGGRRKHPPYVSPGQTNRPQNQPGRENRSNDHANFDPISTLRQLDNFIRSQTQALAQARTQLRNRPDEGRGGKRERGGRGRHSENIWPDTTQPEDNDSLRRYITQLESINADLRTQLEDLATDGQRRAEGLLNADGSPKSEREQLISFLALKLGKDHADFLKLAREPEDEVFREHYRIVAQNVFDILAAEGIHPKPPENVSADLG